MLYAAFWPGLWCSQVSESETSGGQDLAQVLLWVMLLVGTLVFCSDIHTWYARSQTTSRKLTAGGTLAVCFLSTAVYAGSYVTAVYSNMKSLNYIWVPVLCSGSHRSDDRAGRIYEETDIPVY